MYEGRTNVNNDKEIKKVESGLENSYDFAYSTFYVSI